MADGNPTKQDALPAQPGQPSAGDGDPSQPPAFNPEQQAHVDALLKRSKEAQAKSDRGLAAVTLERDSLKSEHATLSQQLADLQKRIDEAEEAAVKDHPGELTMLQRQGKIREAEAKLAADRQAFEAERAAMAERLAAAEAADFEAAVFEAATEARGNPVRLKAMAVKYGVKDAAKLKEMAADLWPRAKVAVQPDSGANDGGAGTNPNLSAHELLVRGFSKK